MSRSAVQIRSEFIEFFQQRGHEIVPGSSVVPYDDPTLLFTNAGMNQFKPLFLGTADRNSAFGRLKRAANSQPCIRAGGKHNDLDDVGRDTYHHTFFEMLGNWSFGDYFKRDAIAWAWELLTQVWGIDPARLHATYFGGDDKERLAPDDEARQLWLSVPGMAPERVHAFGKKDNFWEMGDTGPCGPCSEIHIDLTPDKSGGKLVNAGDHRVMEIWNLVFIQFNRGNDAKLSPLPAKHVDTGMGFERIAGVLQGHGNNYATESFTPIIEAVERLSGVRYGASIAQPPLGNRYAAFARDDMRDMACRVIADHIRTLTFALCDGATPDKEGRGYVLRRILRRAVRYGWQHLELREPFLCRLAPTVVDALGGAFPQLRGDKRRIGGVEQGPKPVSATRIVELLREEEESFARTLDRGIALFNEAAERATHEHQGEIRGDAAFKLHDTYGFPIDLTQIMAQERKLEIDIGEYERLMEEARDRARGVKRESDAQFEDQAVERIFSGETTDDSLKYVVPFACDAVITGLAFAREGSAMHSYSATGSLIFAADRTPFYAEQGGQVSDIGAATCRNAGGQIVGEIRVDHVAKRGEHVAHRGVVTSGSIPAGANCELRVDRPRRLRIMQNHTATHILNWALREVLGDDVHQKGSLVDPDKTRFDFSHPRALSPQEIEQIEVLCKNQIQQNLPVYAEEVAQAEALTINGLRAVFGEKYPDRVRVVSIGKPVDELLRNPDAAEWRKYSVEFCGGTHVKDTGDIKRFTLTSEEGVAKGVRRVVGVSGDAAERAEREGSALVERAKQLLAQAAAVEALNAQASEIQEASNGAIIPIRDRLRLRELLGQLQERIRAAQKQASDAGADTLNAHIDQLLPQAQLRGGATIFVFELPEASSEQLKGAADRVKQKAKSAAVLIGVRDSTAAKVTLLAAMTDDLIKKGLKAGDLVKHVAPLVGGGGGGPPTMAQAGGKNPDQLPAALAAGLEWIQGKLT